jgi:Ca2+-binding EF-hand superfamily protein
MKRFDRDGDGRLDDAERAEALDTLKQKGGDLEGQARALLLARFDADSSGTLGDAERKTALTEIMTQVERNGPLVKSTILGAAVRRFDIDGNGTLDAGERAALGDEVARRWLGQPAGEPARRVVTREALRKTLLDRFDTDQDGRFDATERSAAVAEIESILDGGEPDGGDRAVSRITPPSARPSSPP